MDTQNLTVGATDTEGTQLATDSVCQSYDGLQSESKKQVPALMGHYFDEADPIHLCKAICLVFERRMLAGEKPSGDKKIHSTRKHRPALVAEIEAVWHDLTGVDAEEDLFPYHESYVVQKWLAFRKLNDCIKAAWIAASKD